MTDFPYTPVSQATTAGLTAELPTDSALGVDD